MSYQMQRFLFESGGDPNPLHRESAESASRFLPQDIHIQSGRPTKKGRKRSQSKVSHMSMRSCGTSHSLMSMRYSQIAGDFGVDSVSGAGGWCLPREDATYWGNDPLAVNYRELLYGDDDEPSYKPFKNYVDDTGVKPDLSTQRHIEKSAVEDSSLPSVDPCVNSTEEDSYPLPRAWMTRSASEEEHQVHLPLGRGPDTRNKPTISILTLAKAAILLKRWIRKKHPPIETTHLVLPDDCPILIPDVIPEEPWSALEILERNHATYVIPSLIRFDCLGAFSYSYNSSFASVNEPPTIPMHDQEELSSSSYADSVDSLEYESMEDSQDEERNNYLPSCIEEFALYSEYISGFQGLFDRLPDELEMELRDWLANLTASLLHSWLNNYTPLQCPAQPSGPPTTSTYDATNSSSNPTPPVGGGQKRTSSDANGSFPTGDNSEGNRKRPRTKVEPLSGSRRRGWACPYYQRDPHQYCVGEWHLCAKGPGFSQVHRVK